jgi:hypothetical protein
MISGKVRKMPWFDAPQRDQSRTPFLIIRAFSTPGTSRKQRGEVSRHAASGDLRRPLTALFGLSATGCPGMGRFTAR